MTPRETISSISLSFSEKTTGKNRSGRGEEKVRRSLFCLNGLSSLPLLSFSLSAPTNENTAEHAGEEREERQWRRRMAEWREEGEGKKRKGGGGTGNVFAAGGGREERGRRRRPGPGHSGEKNFLSLPFVSFVVLCAKEWGNESKCFF